VVRLIWGYGPPGLLVPALLGRIDLRFMLQETIAIIARLLGYRLGIT
jgi:hypothetical protein